MMMIGGNLYLFPTLADFTINSTYFTESRCVQNLRDKIWPQSIMKWDMLYVTWHTRKTHFLTERVQFQDSMRPLEI